MSAQPRVLLTPAGSPEIGGGHVMRAIALAEALKALGASCILAVEPYGAALARRFGEDAATVHHLPVRGAASALATAVAAVAPDVLVLDDYRADASWVGALGPGRPRVVAIDDLADRRHACDLLVDPGYGRQTSDYAGLIPAGRPVLAGPAYAMLRPGFARDLGRPEVAHGIGRVFVSLGLSDVGAVSARVVERIRTQSPHVFIDVALAAEAPSVAALRGRCRADPRLALHLDARDVAALMRRADVAVGAGGASTWERCALALPSLTVIVADNQRRGVEALAADGVVLACDLSADTFESSFDAAWRRLQDPDLRATLAARSAALCDGRGAERVAEAVLAL